MTTESKIQIPIRINPALHQRFVAVSKMTKIPMSILARDALEHHLSDIETYGIEVILKKKILIKSNEN